MTEEKFSDLKSLAENQKNEIRRLALELEKYRRKEQNELMGGSESKHGIEREYEERLEEIQIKFERERQAQEELLDILRGKGGEKNKNKKFLAYLIFLL